MIKDKEIILNLSLNFEKETKKLDENIVVGVDLGIAIPACVSLNIKGKEYIRKILVMANVYKNLENR